MTVGSQKLTKVSQVDSMAKISVWQGKDRFD